MSRDTDVPWGWFLLINGLQLLGVALTVLQRLGYIHNSGGTP